MRNLLNLKILVIPVDMKLGVEGEGKLRRRMNDDNKKRGQFWYRVGRDT